MPYIIKTIAREKDKPESVIEIPINPKNRTKLKNLLYVSYPYGAWFTQRLLSHGKVKVSIIDGDAFVDEEIEGADFECLYELKPVEPEEYRAKIMELAK